MSFGAHEGWDEAVGSISGVPITQARIGVDASPSDDEWRTTCGVQSDGALLVRPDQHVAWRSPSLPEQPGAALAIALGRIVGRAPR